MPFDDQSELFYLVDVNDNELGSVSRKEAHIDPTKIHRAIDVLVTNNNQLLLQKRSAYKDKYPGFWTISASGHVTFGQSYEEAANRELKEELGIEAALTFWGKYLFESESEREYCAIFTTTYHQTPTNFDRTEVEEVRWVTISELPEFIRQHQVTPAAKKVLKLVGLVETE